MQVMGRRDALEIIASPIGFSLEAHIQSRNWLLCGQSDIDYYAPKLNRGVVAHWKSLNPFDLLALTKEHVQIGKGLIIETESRLIPYYNRTALGSGMPHAFIIFGYDKKKDSFLIYDKLIPNKNPNQKAKKIQWIERNLLLPAFDKKLFYLDYMTTPPEKTLVNEFEKLIISSVNNIYKTVPRGNTNFQAFGVEALKILKEAIYYFPAEYYDDIHSLWLLNHHIPIDILQSVYGNRFIFKRVLSSIPELYPNILKGIVNSNLLSWSHLKHCFKKCANGTIKYSELSRNIENIITSETQLAEKFYCIIEERGSWKKL